MAGQVRLASSRSGPTREIAAVPGPLGYLFRTRRRALLAYLLVWAVIFPVQTIVVHAANTDDIEPLYYLLNAGILAGGVGLNVLGSWVRERRAARRASVI